jgi:stage II sporulation protein E
LDGHDLGIPCRKEGRLLSELHRAQEQLRLLRSSREAQKESRSALLQQYQFLAEYLQDLSDELGKRTKAAPNRYQPQISLCSNRREGENGDRFQVFSGTGSNYYVLLCDGMGTGLGAVSEGNQAQSLLKKLLTAGFPAEYALRSLNSLCALRGMAGAVTVDLAQLQLDTGKVMLYKWGAAPSYLLSGGSIEKIGTAGPPPGLSVTDGREKVERLSLRRGEVLVLLSDGVGGEDALQCRFSEGELPLKEIAVKILDSADPGSSDDATVAVIRLTPESTRAS